jgi:hypothetical protein
MLGRQPIINRHYNRVCLFSQTTRASIIDIPIGIHPTPTMKVQDDRNGPFPLGV